MRIVINSGGVTDYGRSESVIYKCMCVFSALNQVNLEFQISLQALNSCSTVKLILQLIK